MDGHLGHDGSSDLVCLGHGPMFRFDKGGGLEKGPVGSRLDDSELGVHLRNLLHLTREWRRRMS